MLQGIYPAAQASALLTRPRTLLAARGTHPPCEAARPAMTRARVRLRARIRIKVTVRVRFGDRVGVRVEVRVRVRVRVRVSLGLR